VQIMNMPLEQIANISLNDLGRKVTTHDKNKIGTRMDEMLVALDPGNHVSSSGGPSLSFHCSENHLLHDLRN